MPTLYVATNGLTDMTKLIDAFRNFANAPEKYFSWFFVALTQKDYGCVVQTCCLIRSCQEPQLGGGGLHVRVKMQVTFFPNYFPHTENRQSEDSEYTVTLMTVSVLSV